MVMAERACAGRLGGCRYRQETRWGSKTGHGSRARANRVSRVPSSRASANRVSRVPSSRICGAKRIRCRSRRISVLPALWATGVAVARKLTSVWVAGPGLVGLAVVVALSLVYLQASCIVTGHEIVALKKQLADLQAENERLQVQVVKLTAPDRIEQLATERLGMVRPVEGRLLVAEPVPSAVATGGVPAKMATASSWLRQGYAFLEHLIQGQGALAGTPR